MFAESNAYGHLPSGEAPFSAYASAQINSRLVTVIVTQTAQLNFELLRCMTVSFCQLYVRTISATFDCDAVTA